MSSSNPAAVVILAAGEGTRMRSATPKPLHAIGGRSLLGHALTAAKALAPGRIVVVVRNGRDQVAAHALELEPAAMIVDQDEIPGTGRAVQCAQAALDEAYMQAKRPARPEAEATRPVPEPDDGLPGEIVVMSADAPLIDGATLTSLYEVHRSQGNAVTILTAEVANPTGYGRIVRDATTGDVLAIVEERDATDNQRAIREINSSTYVFDAAALRQGLGTLDRDNAQGEVLLTDVIVKERSRGGACRAMKVADPWIIEGVNDRVQLATVGKEINRRQCEAAMRAGVTIVDPASTWIDVGVVLEPDVTLLPGTHLKAGTVVEAGAVVGPDTMLEATIVRRGATVNRTYAIGAEIGEEATVGPWTHLRPGTVLGRGAKAGSFVEIKAAEIGEGAKVPHLSYVGDAVVGEGTNIGAATIFANYDGVAKSRTQVGRHARIGSDTILVAPVRVGDGAYTGAGSVIKEDVPPGALAVNAVHQRTIPGWVEQRRAGTPAARAAQAAEETNPHQPSEGPNA